RLSTWTQSEFAASRARLILAAQPDLDAPPEQIARSLVLHSLAHMLIDEMSLTSGYPAASIRERVYDDEGQTGVLVFTATADSAGSLGGLAAQSDPGRFTRILHSAVERARWC